jgi:transcriptional regulator with XRE-family HTH domain
MSLKELACLTGSSVSAIHRYESGWDRFEIRTLRRLAVALGAELEIRLNPVGCSSGSPEDANPPASEAMLEAIAPLFWDTDLTHDHLRKYPQWVLRRVLEYGDGIQVSLSRRYFGDAAVWQASRHRSLDPRVCRFWEVILGEKEPAI